MYTLNKNLNIVILLSYRFCQVDTRSLTEYYTFHFFLLLSFLIATIKMWTIVCINGIAFKYFVIYNINYLSLLYVSTSYYKKFMIFHFFFFLQSRPVETFKFPLQTLRYKKLETSTNTFKNYLYRRTGCSVKFWSPIANN